MDIINYIEWRGDLTFEQDGFNAIDALILEQISYINFDDLLGNEDFTSNKTLKNLATTFRNLENYEERFSLGVLINKKTFDLLFMAGSCERFKDIEVKGYVSKIDAAQNLQFAAVTFILNDCAFIACRGTDDTIAGWKEDFNLAIMDKVPAQQEALFYLRQVANNVKLPLLIGGHSKGGNLSLFAATYVEDKIQERIVRIFNMDGPGLKKNVIEGDDFCKIKSKVLNYIPEGSVVGMLFYTEGKRIIVKSKNRGVMQHDPFSWQVKGKSFITEETLNTSSISFHRGFNSYLSSLTATELDAVITTLFYVLSATEAKTNTELEKNILKNSIKITQAIASIDKKKRAILVSATKKLLESSYKEVPSMLNGLLGGKEEE